MAFPNNIRSDSTLATGPSDSPENICLSPLVKTFIKGHVRVIFFKVVHHLQYD
jgi:hypothetical protein